MTAPLHPRDRRAAIVDAMTGPEGLLRRYRPSTHLDETLRATEARDLIEDLDAALPTDLTRASNPAWTIPANGILIALLIGANRNAFRDQLAAMLEPAYSNEAKPISAEEREAALHRIDEDLLDLELAEEAAIRSAEAVGLHVQRRADADPRAVLAGDDALS